MRRSARTPRQQAPRIVEDVVRSDGRPLDPATHNEAESRLGHSFSDVRVHADAGAAASAESVGAAAYTFGRHVAFGKGRFAPGAIDGRRLLLHELTHVLQQRDGPPHPPGPIPLGAPDSIHERDAAAMTMRSGTVPQLQRQPNTGTPAPAGIQAAIPGLRAAATPAVIVTAFNAVLQQVSAAVIAGQQIAEADARAVAEAAGERLWQLATAVHDFGDVLHFRPLMDIRDAIRAAGSTPLFMAILDAFTWAARGATSINFATPLRRGANTVRVLVTGFDPFVSSGAVPPGEVNPSGAIALELDGAQIDAGGNVVAVVESVVLPVNFGEFATGRVEQIFRLALARGAQAILTVSLDAGIAVGGAVQLEQFVVGVHEGNGTPFERIASEPSIPDDEQRILEPPAAIERIARDVGSSRAQVRAPIVLQFASDTVASAAAADANGSVDPGNATRVNITSASVIEQIISTMHRTSGTGITFELGGHPYTATVIEGPGGSFLSNEVSFRALRLLGRLGRRQTVPSFHTHVPPVSSGTLPESATTRADRRTMRRARRQRGRLIETMRRIIRSLARRINTGSAMTSRPVPP